MDYIYLDTSAFVKRYVEEPGSELIDKIFDDAYKGEIALALSYWNIGEAAVVFDKYRKILGLDFRKILYTMLREVKMLSKMQQLVIINVSPLIIKNSTRYIFQYHISYICS